MQFSFIRRIISIPGCIASSEQIYLTKICVLPENNFISDIIDISKLQENLARILQSVNFRRKRATKLAINFVYNIIKQIHKK